MQESKVSKKNLMISLNVQEFIIINTNHVCSLLLKVHHAAVLITANLLEKLIKVMGMLMERKQVVQNHHLDMIPHQVKQAHISRYKLCY